MPQIATPEKYIKKKVSESQKQPSKPYQEILVGYVHYIANLEPVIKLQEIKPSIADELQRAEIDSEFLRNFDLLSDIHQILVGEISDFSIKYISGLLATAWGDIPVEAVEAKDRKGILQIVRNPVKPILRGGDNPTTYSLVKIIEDSALRKGHEFPKHFIFGYYRVYEIGKEKQSPLPSRLERNL